MSVTSNSAESMLLVTGVVLLILFALLAMLTRRVQIKRAHDIAKIINLTQQHQLHIVELAGRNLLIGTGPQGAPSLLCELEPCQQKPKSFVSQSTPVVTMKNISVEHGG